MAKKKQKQENQEDLGNLGAVDLGAGLHPYIVYRNPEDDPILTALQEAAEKLRKEGKPLIRDKPASEES